MATQAANRPRHNCIQSPPASAARAFCCPSGASHVRLNRPAPRPSVVQLLDREVSALDELMADLRSGPLGQGHFDALEERAHGIAARIRGAFRGGQ